MTYLPTLNFSFVNFDDGGRIYGNPAVTGGAATTWRDTLLTPYLGYPTPVTVASYRMEHMLYGLRPAGYHATNVALHALNTALVFVLGLTVGLRRAGAAFAALLFALHPVAAEPVSWVTGRKDLLATCFGLAALLVHVRARSRLSSFAAVVLFTLAVFSKPSVAMLPAAAFVFDRLVRNRTWGQAALRALPMMIVAGIAIVLGSIGQSRTRGMATLESASDWLRNMWFALGHHTGQALLIYPPQPKYILAQVPPAFSPVADLLPLALMLAVALSLWLLPEKRRPVALGWTFAIAAYAPNSNAFPLVRFLANSYVVLPMVGFGVVIGAAVDRLVAGGRWQSFALAAGAAVLLSVLFVRSLDASSTWKNGVTLWGGLDSIYPTSPQVCRNYGNAYAELERHDEALAHYLKCAEMHGRPLVAKNIGIVLFRMGKHDQAREVLLEAAGYAPDDQAIKHYLQTLEAPSTVGAFETFAPVK